MAGQHTSRWIPRPLCACGCGRHTRRPENKYASNACVPAAVRSAAAKKSRQEYTYRHRATFFRAELARLKVEGRRITTEDLLEVMARVYRRGYHNGHQAFNAKGWALKGKVA